MTKTIALLLLLALVVSCSENRGDGREGYFSLSELSARKGTPLFVEKNSSEEFSEIHYYPYPEDQTRFLIYLVDDQAVVGMGWVRAEEGSPLRKKIYENQTTQTTQ